MGQTHFSGPVFSLMGFGGQQDASGSPTVNAIDVTSAPTVITTAGAATYTIAQLLTGLILRDPTGASRTDVLPTAALVVAGLTTAERSPMIGTTITFEVHNTADAAETLIINLGTGGTSGMTPSTYYVFGTTTIAQNGAPKTFYMRLTNVTVGAEAYVMYVA